MGVGQSYSMALEGLEGLLVTVECDLGRGLPGVSVVGLGDAAVVQARDRIRSAMHNSALAWPQSRVVMSLSPASIPKAGAGFDLAMVCALLSAQTGGKRVQERLARTVLTGELGLDGSVRPVPGIVSIVRAAARHGFAHVVVPRANAHEAYRASASAEGVDVLVADNLASVLQWVRTGIGLHPPEVSDWEGPNPGAIPDLADVVCQPEARRAVEIAAAGGHNLMLSGPPGSGKSMLAERLPGILPPMTREEQLEVAAIHSIAGSKGNLASVWAHRRPYVAPHHSVTAAALIGGGSGRPLPGAVSLAHHGVLFIDEVAEARSEVLDCLRVPMELRRVEIQRARRSVRFPAQFQLVLAANPCPCGAERASKCRCPSGVRARYQARLSGPLRDRIDIFARTRSSTLAVIQAREEGSAAVAARVREASERGRARWKALRPECSPELINATVPGTLLRLDGAPSEDGLLVLQELLREGAITQRGVDRALRVAWTLADLEGVDRPGLSQVMDAVEMYSPMAMAEEAA